MSTGGVNLFLKLLRFPTIKVLRIRGLVPQQPTSNDCTNDHREDQVDPLRQPLRSGTHAHRNVHIIDELRRLEQARLHTSLPTVIEIRQCISEEPILDVYILWAIICSNDEIFGSTGVLELVRRPLWDRQLVTGFEMDKLDFVAEPAGGSV